MNTPHRKVNKQAADTLDKWTRCCQWLLYEPIESLHVWFLTAQQTVEQLVPIDRSHEYAKLL